MIDFTSALYLGLQHPSRSLRPWRSITTGAPAALAEPPVARWITRALSELQGCEAAILAPSTLHLAWDLFGLLAEKPITILMDAGVYAISRWGVQRAAMLGATVRTFPHHNAAALERALATTPRDRTPVIVTDGVCPNCGRVAPLESYRATARKRGGLLVIDDTQALGVLGHSPNPQLPFGRGGGGSLRWCGIDGTEVLVFASLAKGLGVPVAVLAGSRTRVRAFEAKSLTRIHCSPPSIAVLHAAERAVVCNRRVGDLRRARLSTLVRRFQRGLGLAHRSLVGAGFFPVQSIRPPSGMTAAELHDRLLESGLRTVLRRSEDGTPCVSLLLSARHTADEIDSAAAAIRDAIEQRSPMITHTRKEPHHEEPVCH